MITQRHADAMRELAEHRAYRLSGYARAVTCTATNAEIAAIENLAILMTGRDNRENASLIVNRTIDMIIKRFT